LVSDVLAAVTLIGLLQMMLEGVAVPAPGELDPALGEPAAAAPEITAPPTVEFRPASAAARTSGYAGATWLV